MIYAAINCAKQRRSGGRACPQYDATLPPDKAGAWFERTIAERGWFVDDDGNCYCPAHNPTDTGQVVEVTRGPAYALLGESGWEARLPDSLDWNAVPIEIRPARLTATEPEDASPPDAEPRYPKDARVATVIGQSGVVTGSALDGPHGQRTYTVQIDGAPAYDNIYRFLETQLSPADADPPEPRTRS